MVGVFQRHGSTQSQHQAFFGPFDENQFQLTKGGFINLLTTVKIKERFHTILSFTVFNIRSGSELQNTLNRITGLPLQ